MPVGPRGCGSDQHIVLVGMMGTGKSTVGRILAQRLRRPLIDTDTEIEALVGRSIRSIFLEDGEPVFREVESRVLHEALCSEPSVIASGGGIVLAEHNRELLRSSGARVIWLKADPKSLVERVATAGHRPLLDADPLGTLMAMFEARKSLYSEVAGRIISVDQRSAIEVAEAILR